MSVRVGVVGAAGRMGQVVCRSILDAPDLDLVAAVSPRHARLPLAQVTRLETGLVMAGELDALTEADADVAVDFTVPGAVADNVAWCLEHRVHVVVGTTGWSDPDFDRLRQLSEEHGANVVVAPNFALGAVLMMHFAQLAARHLPDVEIIELHHEGKRDAPSGTAMHTADLIAAARAQTSEGEPAIAAAVAEHRPDVPTGARGVERGGIRVHAVRLLGLVAHQEVLFGAQGQTLTIRHDTVDRTAFVPGVLLAVRNVPTRPGVTVGLEQLLELEAGGEADRFGGATQPRDHSEVTR